LYRYGFGEQKTPQPFVSACDKFVFTEILRPDPPAKALTEASGSPSLKQILLPAIEATAPEDGWSPLSAVSSLIAKTHPAFDSRNYGFSKLGTLVRRQAYLETKEVPAGDGSTVIQVFVRPKRT
jgi:hypothetical protein